MVVRFVFYSGVRQTLFQKYAKNIDENLFAALVSPSCPLYLTAYHQSVRNDEVNS
jgi:hypothetical protein